MWSFGFSRWFWSVKFIETRNIFIFQRHGPWNMNKIYWKKVFEKWNSMNPLKPNIWNKNSNQMTLAIGLCTILFFSRFQLMEELASNITSEHYIRDKNYHKDESLIHMYLHCNLLRRICEVRLDSPTSENGLKGENIINASLRAVPVYWKHDRRSRGIREEPPGAWNSFGNKKCKKGQEMFFTTCVTMSPASGKQLNSICNLQPTPIISNPCQTLPSTTPTLTLAPTTPTNGSISFFLIACRNDY